jgi:hypothetical protein
MRPEPLHGAASGKKGQAELFGPAGEPGVYGIPYFSRGTIDNKPLQQFDAKCVRLLQRLFLFATKNHVMKIRKKPRPEGNAIIVLTNQSGAHHRNAGKRG